MELYGSYGYGSYEDHILMTVLLTYLIVFLVMGIGWLVSFVLKGFGMYAMAKRCGMQHPWLAFIPFARTYLQGTLAGDIKLKRRTMRDTGIWLLVLPFMFNAVYITFFVFIWLIGFGTIFTSFLMYGDATMGVGRWGIVIVLFLLLILVAAAYEVCYKVFRALVNRQIYGRLTTDSMAMVHAMLGVMVPLYESICFFVMRNKTTETDMTDVPVEATVSMIPQEVPQKNETETVLPEETVEAEADTDPDESQDSKTE